MCQRDLGIKPLLMSLPSGSGGQLEGVLDLLQQRVITSRTEIPTVQQLPIPENAMTVVADARKCIQEAAAERDDRLLEQYLAAGELTQKDLIEGLRLGVQAGTLVPLYCGSAIKNIGIVPLLNAIVDFLPSPMDRALRAPLEGLHPDTGEAVSRRAIHRRAIFRDCLQDADRPLCRTTVLFAGFVGSPSRRLDGLQQFSEQQREKRTSVHGVGEKTYGRAFGGSRGNRGCWETQRYANR